MMSVVHVACKYETGLTIVIIFVSYSRMLLVMILGERISGHQNGHLKPKDN